MNIKHSDGRGTASKSRGLQRAGAEEEDVDVGRRKQQRELGGDEEDNDRWEER